MSTNFWVSSALQKFNEDPNEIDKYSLVMIVNFCRAQLYQFKVLYYVSYIIKMVQQRTIIKLSFFFSSVGGRSPFQKNKTSNFAEIGLKGLRGKPNVLVWC